MADSLDFRQLDSIIRRLDRLSTGGMEEISDRALGRAGQEMTSLAKGIVHVLSGFLQSELHPEGPFAIGEGTLEMIVSPGAAEYAAFEARRGGSHDYPAETLEGQGIIERLEREVGREVIALLLRVRG